MVSDDSMNLGDCRVLARDLAHVNGLLKIGHMNIGSFALSDGGCKVDELRLLLSNKTLDMFGVTETWAKSYVTNKSISINGYHVYRNDRPARRGGGVCLYISDHIKAKIISRSANTQIEYMFVRANFNNNVLLIGVIYRPPNAREITTLPDDAISTISRYKNVIIMGDFNHNLINQNLLQMTKDFWEANGLHLVTNNKCTHFDSYHNTSSLLDHFVISDDQKLKHQSQFWLPTISKHAFIYMALDYTVQRINELKEYYDIGSINLDTLMMDAPNWNFTPIYENEDVNEKLEHFNNIIRNKFEEYVPKKVITNANNCFTSFLNAPSINRARILSNLAFKTYKKNRSTENWRIYCTYRNTLKNNIRLAKQQFGSRYLSTSQTNKKLWKKIASIGATDSNEHEMASEFSSNQFCTYFSNIIPGIPTTRRDHLIEESRNSFEFTIVDRNIILQAVSNIKSDAVGVDSIRLKFVKIILPFCVHHIQHIVNTSIVTSNYPVPWKCARVTPIAKVADPTSIQEYRPISVLPVLSKIFEIIMKDQIVDYLTNNINLNPCQSGFRKFHSTTTTMLDITEKIRISLNAKRISFLVLLDFSKAFDSVDHAVLCCKLKSKFQFSTSACNLLYSYLTNRQQQVYSGGELSQPLFVKFGVPQGSILGPLLFCMYIDDIVANVAHSNIHLYADDVQLLIDGPVNSTNETIANLNHDLQSIRNWSLVNGLMLNASKTQAICISSPTTPLNVNNFQNIILDGTIIQLSKKVKSLGFVINENLTWDDQINNICSKVGFALKRLRSVSSYVPLDTRKRLVMALIVPHFLYGSEIYTGCSNSCRHKLNVSFNSCVRYIYNISRYESISTHVSMVLGSSLDTYLQLRNLVSMYKLITLGIPVYMQQYFRLGISERTRQIIVPRNSSVYMGLSFASRTIVRWNSLPIEIRNLQGFGRFKTACKIHLGFTI